MENFVIEHVDIGHLNPELQAMNQRGWVAIQIISTPTGIAALLQRPISTSVEPHVLKEEAGLTESDVV
jgi:hypothetical protein